MSFLMSKKKNSRYSMTLFESTLSRNESVMAVVPIYYAENVDSVCLLGWNIHILVTELMLIKKFEYLIARFLSCCLLPNFPGSARSACPRL